MSYLCTEDPDGVFLSGEEEVAGGDEVDFSRAAVNLVTLADIPPVFVQRKGEDKKCIPGNRVSLIKRSWGKVTSNVVERTNGVLALVSFGGCDLTEDIVNRIHRAMQKTTDGKLELLRWHAHAILLSFDKMEYYKRFGDDFIQGKFDLLDVPVTKINGASFINPPPCFVEVLAPPDRGGAVQAVLNGCVASFSGAFTHGTVLESRDYPADAAVREDLLVKLASGCVPSVAIVLLFAGRAQRRAEEARAVLSASPWQPVALPGPLADEVGFDTEYYVHTEVPLPLIGIRTGAPSPGVQIATFVQNPENFDRMVGFYQNKVGKAASDGPASKIGLLSKKFPLSSQSDLLVAFYPGLRPININVARLSVQETSRTITQSQSDEVILSQDIEGNKVQILSCLK